MPSKNGLDMKLLKNKKIIGIIKKVLKKNPGISQMKYEKRKNPSWTCSIEMKLLLLGKENDNGFKNK